MIAYGVAVASRQKYETMARPGLDRVLEADSVVLTREGCDSIQQPYNDILDEVCGLADLEAVVLLHEDTEITDPRFCEVVRAGLAEPSVGLLGPIGGREVSDIIWGLSRFTFGRVHAPEMMQDGYYRGNQEVGWHDVEAVDGIIMVLSPWVARRIRFDMRFARWFHGYDVDFSFAVRAAGKRCVVAPFDVTHYGTWKPAEDLRWTAASNDFKRKWGIARPMPARQIAWA